MGALRDADETILASRWWRIEASRAVAADPGRVWDVVGDEAGWLSWYRPLTELEVIGEPTTGVGTVLREREWLWRTTTEVVRRDEGSRIDLITRSINIRGLLTKYYRSVTVVPADDGAEVTITGAFRLGILGWGLLPYTYPQMLGALFFEYRSALRGLEQHLAETERD